MSWRNNMTCIHTCQGVVLRAVTYSSKCLLCALWRVIDSPAVDRMYIGTTCSRKVLVEEAQLEAEFIARLKPQQHIR